MKGKLLDFNLQTNQGVIRAEDQQRYTFSIDAWREDQAPQRGMWVDFEVDAADQAIDLYLDTAIIAQDVSHTANTVNTPTQSEITSVSLASAQRIQASESTQTEAAHQNNASQLDTDASATLESKNQSILLKKPAKVQMEAEYSMMDWIKKCFINFSSFKGRARRKEFWYFQLWCLLFSGALLLLSDLLGIGDRFFRIFAFITVLPNIAVSVRRLHDVNQSGWLVLISLVPFIGFLFLAVMYYIREGDPNGNSYGRASK